MLEATFKIKLLQGKKAPKNDWTLITANKGSKKEGPYHKKFRKSVNELVKQETRTHTKVTHKTKTMDTWNPRKRTLVPPRYNK